MRTPSQPHPAGAPNGKIGLKIADVPPHKVLSVTELMNKDGKNINEQVQVALRHCASFHLSSVTGLAFKDKGFRVEGRTHTVASLRCV